MDKQIFRKYKQDKSIMRREKYILEVENLTWSELGEEAKSTILRAKENSGKAYSPYSKFSVGAAILLNDGNLIDGNNQENIAYPSGLCAERVAVFSAGATHPDVPIKILAIAAQTDGKFTDNPISPCGACRQVLSECETRYGQEMEIYLFGEKHIYHIHGAKHLLPITFSF